MLDKVLNFFKSNKYTISWTVCYFIATWAIMRYMFNFDIFSRLRWWQLMHAHLHGFAGLVFGVLLLAAIPMYIATTVVIARTGTPLFNNPFPKTWEFIKKVFTTAFIQTPIDAQPTEQAPDNTETTETVADSTVAPAVTPVPENIPREMLMAYAHARERVANVPQTTTTENNAPLVTPIPQPIAAQIDTPSVQDMPIPTDFDIEDTDDILGDVPQFTDINFDDDDDDTDDDTPLENIQNLDETIAPIAKFMESNGVPYTTNNDVVVTDKYAIVAHTDNDFWVADDENWFAAGKTRKSPIAAVLTAAATNNVQPVIYLGADNIMDIDELRKAWTSAGIRIISDLDELK